MEVYTKLCPPLLLFYGSSAITIVVYILFIREKEVIRKKKLWISALWCTKIVRRRPYHEVNLAVRNRRLY